MWTVEELLDRTGRALAAGYSGPPNGRVRELPDRRAIRWYATLGLVDRPVMSGRLARYGPRHLLQLVAIKRRQADGRTLAEIQAELTGAGDATLAGIARVPDDLLATVDAGADGHLAGERGRFWAQPAGGRRPTPGRRADPTPLAGVPLGDGVVLLVPAGVDADDCAAIAAAAHPLLDLLRHRGLLRPDRSPAEHHPPHPDGSPR